MPWRIEKGRKGKNTGDLFSHIQLDSLLATFEDARGCRLEEEGAVR